MNIFPNSHEQFINWSKDIAFEMQKSSNGKLRVGFNKLAAIMAQTLPNTHDSFNINTLKSILDKPSEIKTDSGVCVANNGLSHFVEMVKKDLARYLNAQAQAIYNQMPLNKEDNEEESLFDSLNSNYEINEFYSDLIDLDDASFKLAFENLQELDSECIENAYSDILNNSSNFLSKKFSYVIHNTVNDAYGNFVLDALDYFLQSITLACIEFTQVQSMTLEQFHQWMLSALSKWNGSYSFNNEDNYREFNTEQTAEMEFDVVLRCIITAKEHFFESYSIPSPWESYDYSSLDSETHALRADTVVRVQAKDKYSAISIAKMDAPVLNIQNDSAEVVLWVDDSLPSDVEIVSSVGQ